ncbi:MAG TPA: 50S ribosomal protein L29 [Sinorhizobium sp.]|nr:50S ribosomal protein L29 [Sinorhizobium sp.]
MTGEQVRELDALELAAKEREAREQLFRLRFQLQMGQTDGLKKYRVLKKDLARILSVRRERELAKNS